MKLYGLDFETTGLDTDNDVVTEVGSVLWDTERRAPLIIDNFFVYHEEPQLSKELEGKTGITQQDLNDFGLPSDQAFHRMMDVMCQAEAVVAHNGEIFDRLIHTSWAKRILGEESSIANRMLWIDTTLDIDYPEDMGTRKLPYLAAEHGFLNPFSHRAVFDVLTMLRILDKYPLEDIIYSAEQPIVIIEAIVSYNDRQMAKDLRFYWDPKKKAWLKNVKKHKFEATQFPFRTRITECK